MEHQLEIPRRTLLAGAVASAVLALPGCAAIQRYTLVDVVRRLLALSVQRAFARLTAPGGFWDDQVTRLDLPRSLGAGRNILGTILTSALFKDRLQREFNHIAEQGARRAAPVVADAVEKVGIANAKALIAGRPDEATTYLRGQMTGALIDVMVPELGETLRVSQDPLVAQLLQALTGVDISTLVRELAGEADDAIWREIGRQEASIRADPKGTGDPALIGALPG